MIGLARFLGSVAVAAVTITAGSLVCGSASAVTVTVYWNFDPSGPAQIGDPAGNAAGTSLLGYYCAPICLPEGAAEDATRATGFLLANANAGTVATAMNQILDPDGTFGASDVLRYNLVDGVDNKQDFSFQIATLYFSLKVGDITAFFKNTSGGVLAIHYTQSGPGNQGGRGLSHYDQIGEPIATAPLPAALPLFATALMGGGLLSWRRRRGS